MNDRPLIVVTDDSIHPMALERLRLTYRVRVLPGAFPAEDVLAREAAEATAILARLGTVTAQVIASAPNLRIVARHGVGIDAVDIAAATARGVVVTSTGAVNAASVAEYAFALLLAVVRKVPAADAGMRQGGFDRHPLLGTELEGKTLGIIGFGAIGSRMARQALGFGMSVLAQSGSAEPSAWPQIGFVRRAELLPAVDILSLHGRMTPATRHTIDAPALAAMKPGAFIVNTARGELIDEEAMIAALASGHLGGAALDTFETEPLSPTSPLRSMSNVVLSPHVAGQTGEALLRVGMGAADAIIDELAGRRPAHVHNPQAYEQRALLTPRK